MNRLFLASAVLASLATPAPAAVVSVANVGTILNQSKALPAEATPGLGIPFAQFFSFNLPVTETVSASISDSGIGDEKIVGGILSLNTQTGIGPAPLSIPIGTLITSSPFTDTAGGQEATVGPNILGAGNYFAEVSGNSGASPINLAIDGTVTATTTVPEPATWAMMLIGFGFMAWGAMTRRQVRSILGA
jgi:hypothetical protein